MNGTNDSGIVGFGLIFKIFDYTESCSAVESTCWLITQKQVWIRYKLVSNGCPFPLAAGDAFVEYSTYLGVFTLLQAQSFYDIFNLVLYLPIIEIRP